MVCLEAAEERWGLLIIGGSEVCLDVNVLERHATPGVSLHHSHVQLPSHLSPSLHTHRLVGTIAAFHPFFA